MPHNLGVWLHCMPKVMQITGILARRARAQGKTGIRDYLDSRPVVAELEAIERAILFAQETGCKLHIVHVSSGRGVALVVEARAKGIDVSCETCSHYLVLTEDDVERLGAVAKCAPPLRSREVQEELWQQLFAGNILDGHVRSLSGTCGDENQFRLLPGLGWHLWLPVAATTFVDGWLL